MLASITALLPLFVYWVLGLGYVKPSDIPENKTIRTLAKIGFGGNLILLIFSILIIIGFGIAP